MINQFKYKTIAGSLLFALAAPSYALHLGEPVPKSFFGEPLRVEIPILDTAIEESKELKAKSVSYPYGKKFPGHPEFLVTLKFENDNPILVLTSPAPVFDPVFDVAIELTWAAGRMVQPLTVLVDSQSATTKKPIILDSPATHLAEVKIVNNQVIKPIQLEPVAKTEPKTITKVTPVKKSTPVANAAAVPTSDISVQKSPVKKASSKIDTSAVVSETKELKPAVSKIKTDNGLTKVADTSAKKTSVSLSKLEKIEALLASKESRIRELEQRMEQLLAESRRLDLAIEDAKFDAKFKQANDAEHGNKQVSPADKKAKKQAKKQSRVHVQPSDSYGLTSVISAYKKA